MFEYIRNIISSGLQEEHTLLIKKIILSAILSYLLTILAIPKIIRISYKKHLMAVPGNRSSHKNRIPNLGGVAIFYSVIISSTIFAKGIFYQYSFLLTSIILLFFIGIMDDILVVNPRKKLYAQITSSFLISIGSGIRIDNLFGIFGIYEIPYFLSIILTVTLIVFLINAYNLIDGIDGLAGFIGILISFSFAISFFRLGHPNYDYVVLCLIIAFSLLGFLTYNLSKKRKIFMGDTGSLVLGFIFSFFVIRFLGLFLDKTELGIDYTLQSAPLVCLSIFILPVVDTACVFFLRIIHGKSPFSPDKNHIHHRYLQLGLNHLQTSFLLLFLNIIVILTCYIFRHININILTFLIFGLGLLISFGPVLINREIKFYRKEIDYKTKGKDI